jgi:hypothetical protein
MMVRRSSLPSRAQRRTIARSTSRSANSADNPTRKNAESQTREMVSPSLAKNDADEQEKDEGP